MPKVIFVVVLTKYCLTNLKSRYYNKRNSVEEQIEDVKQKYKYITIIKTHTKEEV